MNAEQYAELVRSNPAGRKASLFRGLADDIIIMGMPAVNLRSRGNRFLEGYVVVSGTHSFAVGYASLAWNSEFFEPVTGTLEFVMDTGTPPPAGLKCPNCGSTKLKTCEPTAQAGRSPSWRCLPCNVKFIVTNPSYLHGET